MEIKTKLESLQTEALNEIQAADDLKTLDHVRVSYLGKKGSITEVLRGMKDLDPAERPVIGALANVVRDAIQAALDEQKETLEAEAIHQALLEETIDVTLPGKKVAKGQSHVLTQIMEEIEDLFMTMGYQVIEGPEVEEDNYNFERMNLPKDHPARDMQDTFYITDEVLLRTHTSPVQARTMDKHDFSKGPLKW